MIGREITGPVTRLQLPELEPKDERSGRAPFHVTFTHEIAEPAVWRDVSVFRVVDSTAAAEHPSRAGAKIYLTPPALGVHRSAGHAGILADRAAAEPRERLADERLAHQLRGTQLEPGVERDGAGLEQRIPRQRVESAQPADVSTDRDFTGIVR